MHRKYNVIADPRRSYIDKPTFRFEAQEADAVITTIHGVGYDGFPPALVCQFKSVEALDAFIDSLPDDIKLPVTISFGDKAKLWKRDSETQISFKIKYIKPGMREMKPILFQLYDFGKIDPKVIGMLIQIFRGEWSIKFEDIFKYIKADDQEMALALLDTTTMRGMISLDIIDKMIDHDLFDFAYSVVINMREKEKALLNMGEHCLKTNKLPQAIQCYQAIITDARSDDLLDFSEKPEVHEAKLKLLLFKNNQLNELGQFSLAEQEKMFKHTFYSCNAFLHQSLKLKLFHHLCGCPDESFVKLHLSGKEPKPYLMIAQQMRTLVAANVELKRENESLKSATQTTQEKSPASKRKFF